MGTDSAPGAATTGDPIVVYGLDFDPLSGSTSLDRSPMSVALSCQTPIPGLLSGSLSFRVPLSGASAAATAPPWGRFMLGAGFKQTVTGSTSIAYAPTSTYLNSSTFDPGASFLGMDTLTFYVWANDVAGAASGKLYKLLGCMGKLKLAFKNGEPVTLSFDFDGVYSAPTTVSFPAVSIVTHQAPKPLLNASLRFTPSGGSDHFPVLRSLEIDMGNRVEMNPDAHADSGFTHACLIDRKPKFSLVIEEPTIDGQNWWGNFTAGTTGAITIGPVGTVGGNRWTVTMPNVGIAKVSSSASGGLRSMTIDGVMAPSDIDTGSDEFTLTID